MELKDYKEEKLKDRMFAEVYKKILPEMDAIRRTIEEASSKHKAPQGPSEATTSVYIDSVFEEPSA